MVNVLKNNNTKTLKEGDKEPSPVEKNVVRLYSMRFCPFAQRSLIYLAKHGIESEVININLKEKPQWYFSKHPEGKVPALEYNGQIVLESGLIPEYLDDTFPESRILPSDPFEKYNQKLVLDRLSSIGPALFGLFAAFKDPSLKEEKNAAAEKAIQNTEELLKDAFFGGSNPGYADYLIYPFVQRLFLLTKMGYTSFDAELFPGKQYPKLETWYKTISQLPEIQETSPTTEYMIEYIKSYLAGSSSYDIGI